MAKLKLNKQSLQQERARLKLYERLLPALDLKRRQLQGEVVRSRRELEKRTHESGEASQAAGRDLPMLAAAGLDWDRLVMVTDVEAGEENVVGVKLPVLTEVRFEVAGHAGLDTPAWTEILVARLKEAARLELERRNAAVRTEILNAAVRKITQRVNLFEKVLIPRARENLRRIQIHLDDMDRASVVRSKLAKSGLADASDEALTLGGEVAA